MSGAAARPVGFWRTVWLLLAASRKRAAGRKARQRALLRQRAGAKSLNWGWFGGAFGVLLMIGLNLLAAYVVQGIVTVGERIDAEQHGWVLVEGWFLSDVTEGQIQAARAADPWRELDRTLKPYYHREAMRLAEANGGDEGAIEQRLRDTVLAHDARDFTDISRTAPGLSALPTAGSFPAMLGSLALLWWGVMLAFQGEGLELDTQRRRHPMWEWLFSHPVPAGAVFLAEMIAPVAANPIYYGAPLLPGVLYGVVYGRELGVLAAFVVGVPLTIAAACLGKGLEVGVILRFSPRSRGAMIGLMGWLGYASMMLFFLASVTLAKFVTPLALFLQPLAVLPWPWLSLFLGQRGDGGFSFALGVAFCWSFAAIIIAGSVALGVWGARRGLGGPTGRADATPGPARGAIDRGAGFGREPLYRKEMLWFLRDRSALVQAVLVPLTLAGFQLFNLRGLVAEATSAWNYLCGMAILFGTYFLSALGPRSLASEGSALWISLTWPRGLESLLKAKAWLWALISSAIVGLVLLYAAILYPANGWKVALVGAGWFLFARAMAEKTVTLATVTSASGEVERVPTGRRWAVQLGTLTFAIGVLTRQWPTAIIGIVYAMMTAAAMWQNFRARLPFLFDPWSERLPPPPTLLNAMVAIGILVEGSAVAMGAAAVVDNNHIAIARAVVYAIWAGIVSLGVAAFLARRGVPQNEVWVWRQPESPPRGRGWWRFEPAARGQLARGLLVGAACGLALGAFGLGYTEVLRHIPSTAELMEAAGARLDAIPHLRISLILMSVLVAPISEEYLFRGLLYRALDREWGGWRAAVGSAAFFAIYHPPLSWLPVGLLGLANALLFKRTGRLAPAVILHMVYNAVVLS
jgi:membrane protease YdiL (CAAX protease family)